MLPFNLPIKHYYLLDIRLPIWGTMIFIGTIFSLIAAIYEARRLKLNLKKYRNFLIIFVIFSILGMRFYHFFFVRPSTTNGDYNLIRTILRFFHFSTGVDSLGLILGIATSISYLKLKKLNIWRYLDTLAIPLATLIVIGRVGCFFAQCEGGFETTVPWAVIVYGKMIHPVALYYIISGTILLFLLNFLKRHNLYDGFLINSFLIYYPLSRFIMDFFRVYPEHRYLSLSIHQIGYLFIFISSLFLMINRKYKGINKKQKMTGKT